MKSILRTVALATLITGTAASLVQAADLRAPWFNQRPMLMLVEGGGDRLVDARLAREARVGQDASQRFVQLLEQQPTAAGTAIDPQDSSIEQRAPSYKSPIIRDRELYGSPH